MKYSKTAQVHAVVIQLFQGIQSRKKAYVIKEQNPKVLKIQRLRFFFLPRDRTLTTNLGFGMEKK